MRFKYTMFLASVFAFWSCSGDRVSDPVSPGLPQGNGDNSPPKTAVSVSISIDSVGPDGFVDGDTVSITARVVDNAGAVVDTASVVWFGQRIAFAGKQKARFVLGAGDNFVLAQILRNGVPISSSGIHISAASRPGELVVWNSDGSLLRFSAPKGAYQFVPIAINNRGEVVGEVWYEARAPQHAFIWSQSEGYTELPNPDDADLLPVGINDSGVIAGIVSSSGTRPSHPFTWSRSSGLTVLDDSALANTSVRAINSQGHIAGDADGAAYLWTPEAGVTRDPRSPVTDDSKWSFAVSLNDRDEILTTPIGRFREDIDYAFGVTTEGAMIWSGNQLLDIRCKNCVMSDMNRQHEIVGVLATSPYHAFKWTSQSGVENLASGGYDRSFAMAINESGDIAGYVNSSLQQDIVSRAAVWTSSGLKLLGPVTGIRSTQARDINDVGQVLIYAR